MTKAFPLAIILGAILGFPTQPSDTTLKIIDSKNGPLAAFGEVSFHQEFTADTASTQINLSAEITNTSAKPIVAYEVSIDAFDHGAGINDVAREDHFFHGSLVPGGHEAVTAFATETTPKSTQRGAAIYRVVFVQFLDGSTFGHSAWADTLSRDRSTSRARIHEVLSADRSNLQTSLTAEVDRADNPCITRALMSHVRDTLAKSGSDAAVSELTNYLKLAEERANPQQCENSPKTRQTKIHIVSVEFPANDGLPDELHTLLRTSVEKYEASISAEASDKDWLDELNNATILNVLMNAGYFKQQSRTTAFLVRAEAKERFYAVRIDAQPGALYRMANIQFAGGTVFDQAELRKQIRLKVGEPFNLSAIRDGIESVHRLYTTKGYIDATLEPRMDVDDEKSQIGLTLQVTEEAQYRVGTVEIIGLNDAEKNRLMERLQPGRVFDMSVLRTFRDVDEQSVEIHRNVRDRTVNLVVDARKTGCPDSKWKT